MAIRYEQVKDRLVRVLVPKLTLSTMVRTGSTNHSECRVGVPVNALLVTEYFDHAVRGSYLVFAHESFRLVPEGEVIPIFHVEIAQLSCPKEGNK